MLVGKGRGEGEGRREGGLGEGGVRCGHEVEETEKGECKIGILEGVESSADVTTHMKESFRTTKTCLRQESWPSPQLRPGFVKLTLQT